MAKTSDSPKRRKTAAEWALVRVAAESGELWGELSRKFQITSVAIMARARSEGWRIPLWERKRRLREAAASASPVPEPPATPSVQKILADGPEDPADPPEVADPQLLSNLPKDLREALQSLASAPPESQQEAFGRVSGILIAQGILEIPPPRNVKELATWFSIFQKAHGLDKPKDAGAKDAGLFGSRGSGFRRTIGPVLPAVEVEPVPESGDDYDPDCG